MSNGKTSNHIMILPEKVIRIIKKIAADYSLNYYDVLRLAEKGCEIAFLDNLSERIEKFGGTEAFKDGILEGFILTCVYGGTNDFSIILVKSLN